MGDRPIRYIPPYLLHGSCVTGLFTRDEQTPSIPIIVFHSMVGGTGRSTLLLLTAKLLAEKGFNPLVVDADFEAPTIYMYADDPPEIIRKFEDRELREFYRIVVWGDPNPKTDIVEIDLAGTRVKAVLTNPGIEALETIEYAWTASVKFRIETALMALRALRGLASRAGINIILVDARSGLSIPSQDLYAIADLVVEVNRVDTVSLERLQHLLLYLERAIEKREDLPEFIKEKNRRRRVLIVYNMLTYKEDGEYALKQYSHLYSVPPLTGRLRGPLILPFIKDAMRRYDKPQNNLLILLGAEEVKNTIEMLLDIIVRYITI